MASVVLQRAERLMPRIVASLLAVAALLAFMMAVLAPINHRPDLWRGPPDEYGHRASARYYLDHWLPPRVGDPATIDSYSLDYGFSYLNDTDPVYLLAGKFASLVSAVVPDADRGFRLFNVFLLAALAALAFARPAAALVFAPLLLSPQIWYIFSYCNSDAFPLFLATLLAWQVAEPTSAFNRYLDGRRLADGWPGALLFGLLVALLLLSKKNFLTFVALVPAALALLRFGRTAALLLGAAALFASGWYLKWFALDTATAGVLGGAAGLAALAAAFARKESRRERARVLVRLVALGAIAAVLIAPRYWWDAHVHGSLEKKRLAQGVLQEKIAKPQYKPSTIYSNNPHTYYGIELRARGTPLSELFSPEWAWHSKTFATATGSYGWIQFTASTAYYAAMLAGYLAIAALYGWAVIRSRQGDAAAGLGLVAAFGALTVAIALFHSWNNDFQAQGRYLFPMVAMLGLGLHLVREWLPRRAILAAILYCFALGLYSYVFIGLRWVPGSF